jgi:hypothetical protein
MRKSGFGIRTGSPAMKTTTCIEPVTTFQRPSAQARGWMGSNYTYDVPAPRAVVEALAQAAHSWHYDAPSRPDVTAGAGTTLYGYVAAGLGEFAAETDDPIAANPINRTDPSGLDSQSQALGFDQSDGKSKLRLLSVDTGNNGSSRFYINFNFQKWLGYVDTGGLRPSANLASETAQWAFKKVPGTKTITTWAEALSKCFSWGNSTAQWRYVIGFEFTITMTFRVDKCPAKYESFFLHNIKFLQEERGTWGDGNPASFVLKSNKRAFEDAIGSMSDVFMRAKEEVLESIKVAQSVKADVRQSVATIEQTIRSTESNASLLNQQVGTQTNQSQNTQGPQAVHQ